nr:putative reverse transcriptase domain-containing protein [Tanacetum cinerariifolium]
EDAEEEEEDPEQEPEDDDDDMDMDDEAEVIDPYMDDGSNNPPLPNLEDEKTPPTSPIIFDADGQPIPPIASFGQNLYFGKMEKFMSERIDTEWRIKKKFKEQDRHFLGLGCDNIKMDRTVKKVMPDLSRLKKLVKGLSDRFDEYEWRNVFDAKRVLEELVNERNGKEFYREFGEYMCRMLQNHQKSEGSFPLPLGEVTSSEPSTLNKAVRMAHTLMEQKVKAIAEREANNKKRRWENFQGGSSSGGGNNNSNRNNNNYNRNRNYNNNRNNNQNQCGMKHYGSCQIKCNKCGKIGHKDRDCWSKVVATGANAQPVVTCYGCGEKGHIKTNCPTRNNPGRGGARGQAYALRDGDQNLGPNVVTDTFLLNNRYSRVLFDSGSDKSFVNVNFIRLIDIEPIKVNHSYEVELADGRVVSTNTILRGYALNLVNHLFENDLMPIELGTFDVIIRMNWLILHDAVIVCGKKEVHVPLKKRVLVVKGDDCVSRLKVVSCMKVKKYVDRGSYLFVAQVVEKEPIERRLEDVPVICKFLDVFPKDLPGLPPPRQVEFEIELVPGAAPVARAPYRLAPLEMKDLAKQLHELSDKGFIRPSSSPWGAPVLFVKKKDGSVYGFDESGM